MPGPTRRDDAPTTHPCKLHLPWDGNPPAHPRKLRPSRGQRAPPRFADANAPSPASLRGCAGAAPAPCTPARSSSVVGAAVGRPRVRLSSQPRCGWQAPPADRLRASCSPNCSHPLQLRLHRGRRPSNPQGRVGRTGDCGRSVLRSSVAPTQSPSARPLSISPALGPRNVQWHSGPFPRPRPGSCPPLAPAGAAQTQGGSSGKRALPEPRPARHSPPPGCAFT